MNATNAKSLLLAVTALSSLWLSGCCRASRLPAPDGLPALLSESAGCPPAPAPERRVVPGSACATGGEIVYNLGQKAVSNSASVKLMGGKALPEAFRLPGGVKSLCVNPVPARYYETIGMTPPLPAAAVPPAPAADSAGTEFEPVEIGSAAGGYCAPEAVALPTVCNPGDDCFTLTEEEAKAGPEVHVPTGAVMEPALPAAEPGDKYMDAAPAATAPAAEIETATATAPVPASEIATAPGAFPAESALSSRETMPPVPMVTEMEETVDAILSRDQTRTSSTVPPVELPPAL